MQKIIIIKKIKNTKIAQLCKQLQRQQCPRH